MTTFYFFHMIFDDDIFFIKIFFFLKYCEIFWPTDSINFLDKQIHNVKYDSYLLSFILIFINILLNKREIYLISHKLGNIIILRYVFNYCILLFTNHAEETVVLFNVDIVLLIHYLKFLFSKLARNRAWGCIR
jgi:hypothetical protein